jgi:hypothetical protein
LEESTLSSVAEDRTAALDSLTRKQRRYVEGLVAGRTKFAAALAAGYSEESARNARYVIEREPVRAALQQLAGPSPAPAGTAEPAQEPTPQAQAPNDTAANKTGVELEVLEETGQWVADARISAALDSPDEDSGSVAVRTGPPTGRLGLWRATGLPNYLCGKSLDDYTPQNERQRGAVAQIREYLQEINDSMVLPGIGLIFAGLPELAQLVIAELVAHGREVRGTTMMQIAEAKNSTQKYSTLKPELVAAPLLAVDGIHRPYQDEELNAMLDSIISEMLGEILQARLDANRPSLLLITCSVEALKKALGQVLAGRLLSKSLVVQR